MEVTLEEARAHLGMETQRQWNERAIARTTPALLSLYSIITLTAHQLLQQESPLSASQLGMPKFAPRVPMRLPWCGGICGFIGIFQRHSTRPT